VGYRDGAGLLRVVDEVTLRVVLRLLADDLDRVLVRADGTVGAESEEDGAHAILGLDIELGVHLQGSVGDVIHDPDREVVARALPSGELVKCGLDLGGGEVLRGEAIAATDDERIHLRLDQAGTASFADRRHHIEVERLPDGPGLLRAIEDGDRPHGSGEGLREVLHRERPVETHLEDPDLLSAGQEVVDRLVSNLRAGPHEHDDALGLGVAGVVEEAVGAADALAEPGHRPLHDSGAFQVEPVAGLARLEKDVGVLGRAAQDRLVGGERAQTVRGHEIVTHHEAEVVVLEKLDLPHLVRRAEPVEEVEEGHPRLEGCRVGHEGQVVRFLTDPEARRAKPIWRQAITSEWSPKIDRAWVARVRAATCSVNGVSSPAILYMLGIMRRSPCDAVKVVLRAPVWRAPWTAPATPPSDCIATTSGTMPQRFFRPCADHSSASSPMVDDGVIG
jgi:hypothetical protein